ncbi:glycosyltransferase [Mixta gaviniae]|uniref:Zeaxanthin glucosyltransferase n=1 Tax=Mixta gaviniae TaxID=665914 RepID=A0A2L0ICD9_9GAMM|nr:glycosyltransferase [Mixta gaviniae]AUX92180.1 zeaxanthin glucosyltransferase [Mixta gaviniae]
MSHYAVIAPPLYSHVRALEALAQQLIARGHRVTFMQQAEARTLLSDARIGFCPLGARSHPPGSLARTLRLTAHPSGMGIFRLIDDMAKTSDMLCRELPAALAQAGIDGLIVDQMEAAGGLAAQALGLPFVSVACALPVNREPHLPLPVMPFNYAEDARSQKLYVSSTRVYDWLMRRHGEVIARHARAFGLGERRALHDCLSPLAQISQTLPAFDFPRRQLPSHFHAVGPLRHRRAAPDEAPPCAQPLVFASLGTLQGHRYTLFRAIARACRQLKVRLLIAHCGGLSEAQAARLRRYGAEVTDFADQPAVLRQAQAVITHGGLNTVMDAIESATPILTIPLAFDQPGVAARVVYSGIGRRASRFATAGMLAQHLQALLSNDAYRQRLTRMQAQLERAGGAARAADVVEQALRERHPVLAACA